MNSGSCLAREPGLKKDCGMDAKNFSLTLDEGLPAEARERTGSHDRLAGLLEELEREKGPIEEQVMEEVRRAWPSSEEE